MSRMMKHISIVITACIVALSCSGKAAEETAIKLKMPSGAGEYSAGTVYITAVKEEGGFLFQAQGFTKGGDGTFTGGHYWPVSGRLSFYADNCSAGRRTGSHGSSCMEVQMSSGVDTVTGSAENIINGSAVNLTLGHPFARLYALSISSSDGSDISVNSLGVTCRRSGWYCLRHKSWTSASAPESVSFPASSYSCGDILLVPGEISITLNYTATVGLHSVSYEKTASITLEAGKKTTVYASVGADALQITASAEAETWTETDPIQIVL